MQHPRKASYMRHMSSTLPTMGLQFKQNPVWNVNMICPVSAEDAEV